MGFILFHEVEPALAERETRSITVIKPQGKFPKGTYVLVESYCPDPNCDCRRVMLNIAQKERVEGGVLATISYGFDRDEDMAGPFLDSLNPQSEYSEALLELVTASVLGDRGYVERLEDHYDLVKQAAEDFAHPAYVKIQTELHRTDNAGAFSLGPQQERVARNALCPCGSGEKYKQCCMWKDRWDS